MKYSRRRFIGTAAAGMGALMFNGCFSKNKYHDPYEKVKLGNTDIVTTRLSMGTGFLTRDGQSSLARLSYEQAEKMIHEAYNRGIRAFDLADSYGTHGYVGKALKAYPRSDYALFSKLWFLRGRGIPEDAHPGEETEAEVTRFLKEIDTDYIDCIQLHVVTSGNWNTELSDYMTELDKLKQKGVIRAHGLSCHALPAVETAVNESWVDTIHVRINPYGSKMDDTVEKVEPVVKQLHQAGKGLIGMKILGEGELVESDEQIDNCFSYVLQLGAVDVLTIGIEKISDIEDCEKRIRKVPV